MRWQESVAGGQKLCRGEKMLKSSIYIRIVPKNAGMCKFALALMGVIIYNVHAAEM